MITIEGTPRQSGVAIAAAAKVNAVTGINGVSPDILQQGIQAIKQQLEPQDYPEVVVVCDTLVLGSSIRIPGISTVGIAAESADEVRGLDVNVPCVVGLERLGQSVADDQIIIVDGDRGVVYIDPDPQTLIRYQQKEEREHVRPSVFLASEHLPARTQDGETVCVHALVTHGKDLNDALDQGADGLVVDTRSAHSLPNCDVVLETAIGKPVMFMLAYPELDVLHAAMRLAMPRQVSALFALDAFDAMAEEMTRLVETAVTEAFLRDLDPPQVGIGTFARDIELPQAEASAEPELMLIDIRKSAFLDARRDELSQQALAWLGECRQDAVIFLLGDRLDVLPDLIRQGARHVAVTPRKVQAAKYSIRETSIGEQE